MKTLTLTLTLLLATAAFAQPGWHDISSYIKAVAGENTDFSDVSCTSDDECWVASSNQPHIYHTTDGGATWEVQNVQYSLNAVEMRDSLNGYAGGENGRIYRTTDGGATWTAIGSMGETLTDISCPPEGDTCFCCGDNGTIYGITGNTVFKTESGVPDRLHGIHFPQSSSEGWVCGGNILRHYVNGAWVADQYSPNGGYNTLFMTDTLNGWAFGDGGIIIHTTDGAHWTEVTNPDPDHWTLNGCYFLNMNEGWAVGDHGTILHTTDGGTWNMENVGMTTSMLCRVHFTTSENGYFCGNNGTLIKYGYFTPSGEQEEESFRVEVFPNPAGEKFEVSGMAFQTGGATIALFSPDGRKLLERAVPAGSQKITVDVII